jgi:hypothetical protein
MNYLVMAFALVISAPVFAAEIPVMTCGDDSSESTWVTVTKEDNGTLDAAVEFYDSQLDRSAQFVYNEIQVSTAGPTVYMGKDFNLTVDAGIGLRKGTLQLPALNLYDRVLSCGM